MRSRFFTGGGAGARGPGRAGGKPHKRAFLDVRRAFFRAAATEEVYVELPPEEREPGKDLVGLLEKSIYGTRSGAHNWQRQLGKDLAALGFKQAAGSPCLFYHEEEGASLVTFGDDLWQPGCSRTSRGSTR